MRVVGRIDKHSVAVLLDLPEIEWYWECPACGTESYSMRSDWEHDSARTHAVVCDSLRLQRLLDDLEALAIGLSTRANPLILDKGGNPDTDSPWVKGFFRGQGSGLEDARHCLDALLARHRGAS